MTGGRGPGPHFVDLDDACSGPAVQDLWMLLSAATGAQRIRQLGALVEGYEQFRPFDRRELALIEPLRTLRLLHYSAWLGAALGRSDLPDQLPVVWLQRLLEGARSICWRSSWRRWTRSR
jgi:Ser/Thr protein kinase RdoA (MazF antagonist)